MPKDTLRIKALNEAAWGLKTSDPKLSRAFSREAYELSIQLDYKAGQVEALNLTGNVMDNQGQYAEALSTYRKALRLAQELKAKKNIAGLTNNIGLIFEHTGEPDSAFNYYQQALVLKKALGNKASIASTLNNIGNIYSTKSNYPKALEYYLQSLKLKEELDDKKLMASGYHNVANLYLDMRLFDMGNRYIQKSISIRKTLNDFFGLGTSYLTMGLILTNQQKYSEALAAFNNALSNSKKVNDVTNLGKTYSGLSQCYFGLHNYSLAEQNELNAIALKEEHGDVKGLSVSYNHLGMINAMQKKPAEARHWYSESIRLGENLENRKIIAESMEGISNAYLQEKQLDSAMLYLRRWSEMKDSVISEARIKEIAALQIKYETEVKEREIDSLKLQKASSRVQLLSAKLDVTKRNYLLLLSGLILVGLVIAFSYYRKHQQTQLAATKAKAILETELLERQRMARDMHDELGSGISKIAIALQFAKDNSNDTRRLQDHLATIGKAANELTHGLGDLIWSFNTEDNSLDALLASIRSHAGDYLDETGIDYQINIPDNLPNQNVLKERRHHLFLAFKEALNNAIKYANASLIQIDVLMQGEEFHIVVADNGKVFALEEQRKKGNGLGNMEKRMAAIQAKATISSTPGQGTRVGFAIHTKNLFSKVS